MGNVLINIPFFGFLNWNWQFYVEIVLRQKDVVWPGLGSNKSKKGRGGLEKISESNKQVENVP